MTRIITILPEFNHVASREPYARWRGKVKRMLQDHGKLMAADKHVLLQMWGSGKSPSDAVAELEVAGMVE